MISQPGKTETQPEDGDLPQDVRLLQILPKLDQHPADLIAGTHCNTASA
jgi:hypothetical protein